MNCNYHIQNQISFICLAPHKCQNQRKLCDECFQEHGVEVQFLIPINGLQEIVKKKFQELKLGDISEISVQRINFKSMLSQSQSKFKQILDQFSESAQYIFDMIELQTKSYVHLINQNINPAELSNYDLEILIQILKGESINDWIEQKNIYLNKLEELKVYWDQEEKLFISNIQDKLRGLLSINEQQSSKFTGQTKEIQKSYFQFKALQITTTEQMSRNEKQNFVKDNSNLRIDSIIEDKREPEDLTNLEQIQHLKWVGKYGQNNKKIGLWEATWQGEKIQRVGGEYSFDGKKQGKWIEIIENYQILAQVFKVGEYVRGQKIGFWKYVYENKEMYKLINQFNNNRGGGVYSTEGLKIGKWIELSKGFWKYSQVTHQGEYHNGKKVGRWDIFNRKYRSGSSSKIFQQNNNLEKQYISGGGSYDEAGAEFKIGYWVEMMDILNSDCQIMTSGRYQNGKKIGRWNLYNKKSSMQKKIITIFWKKLYQWWWVI
ncbi:unnamed protein product (macronuclear) [Paramecium tetraurelia]|uniref:MORN repeat protein n=1 Tax=Paramecium tetraurelia TaxID=5888 RepID=A0C5L5_PARTE|nr:uncharacterized protein GSPATT00035211001 [Paramecium tetraurelia]CAK66082.1 unnamed protein product [Paramecium tetraurelia]|eukprot:XP_001433479.1 hypothetical protein (macronuclear) [Paramecium tetraurelia strain d4-2]